eukprot:11990850-Ditylum_brightwellii.AAC.1
MRMHIGFPRGEPPSLVQNASYPVKNHPLDDMLDATSTHSQPNKKWTICGEAWLDAIYKHHSRGN